METTQRQLTGRFLVIASACAMILALLWPLAGPAAARETGVPLDLAAMALHPADLTAEGLDSHGVTNSILTERSRDAGAFVKAWDGRISDSEIFEAADPDRTYILDLSHDIDTGAYLSSIHAVASWIIEFDDDDSAAEGMDAMTDALLSQQGTDEERSRAELGDEQVLVSGTGLDTVRNADFGRMNLFFRVDNLVSGITIGDYQGADAPTRSQIEALGERQMEHVLDVLAGDAPGLSGQFLHLRVPGDMVNVMYYLAFDGEAIRTSTNSDNAFADRQARYDQDGIVSTFHSEVRLWDNYPAGAVYFNNTIDLLADEDAAIRYFDDLESGFREFPDDMVEVPVIGDGAFASRWIQEEGGVTQERYRIFVRVGAMVFYMTQNVMTSNTSTDTEPQPDAVNELAANQVECLTGDESCARSVRVPRELRFDETGNDPGTFLLSSMLPIIGRREVLAA